LIVAPSPCRDPPRSTYPSVDSAIVVGELTAGDRTQVGAKAVGGLAWAPDGLLGARHVVEDLGQGSEELGHAESVERDLEVAALEASSPTR